jgi:hypothetical protein
LLVIVCLSFGRRYIAERFQQAVVVKPGHPFQRSEFDGLTRFPGSATVNQLSLVEPIDGLGQGIVIAVAFAPTDGSIPASASRSLYFIDTY